MARRFPVTLKLRRRDMRRVAVPWPLALLCWQPLKAPAVDAGIGGTVIMLVNQSYVDGGKV